MFFSYEIMRQAAGRLTGYVKVKLDVNAALGLADLSAYPRGVRLGVMKQVASNREITLEQMRILLGWAARKVSAGRDAVTVIERPVIYKALRTVEKHMRVAVIGGCLYEACAVAFPDSRIPPVTVLANRHKAVAAAVATVIGLHIWFYEG